MIVDKRDLLGMSGGGTRFIAHAEAAHELIFVKGYNPGIITGVSAGALETWCLMSGRQDIAKEAIDMGMNMSPELIFGEFYNRPVNAEGNPTIWAILRAGRGIYYAAKGSSKSVYFGRQNGVKRGLQELVPYRVFEDYKIDVRNGKAAEAYVGTVNFKTGLPTIWPLHKLDYDTAWKAVLASSTVAFVSPEIWINNEPHHDGGHYHHNILNVVMRSHPLRINFKKAVSFYVRTDDVLLSDTANWAGLLPKACRVLKVFEIGASERDEQAERDQAKELGMSEGLHQVFINTGMKGLFDLRPEAIRLASQRAKEAIKNLMV